MARALKGGGGANFLPLLLAMLLLLTAVAAPKAMYRTRVFVTDGERGERQKVCVCVQFRVWKYAFVCGSECEWRLAVTSI